MKALLHTEPFRLEYTDVEDPKISLDDVLVRVKACGICGSDLQGYTGKTGRRLPPIIMGHEAAGIVEAVGDNVKGFRRGDRVCFDSTVYCNSCDACRAGRYNHCERRQVLGVSVPAFRRHGAFAEFVSVPHWIVAPLPDSMSFEQAAMLEPVSIGLHAANQARISDGDTVLIVGAGTIGLFVLQAARLKGAGKIIISDLQPTRLRLALELGADVTVRPDESDLVSSVRAETDGRGADVSFEVVGYGSTLRQSIRCARTGGTVVLVGNLEQKVEMDIQDLVSRELHLIGSYASAGEFRQAIGLVTAGKIDVMRIVSEVAPLRQGQQIFDRLHSGKKDLVKVILVND